MNAGVMKILVIAIIGAAYWFLVIRVSGVTEPWDAETYWSVWYPASFVLSALGGALLKKRGWLAGVILTFAQLPIMWLNAETGPLWAVGMVILCALAVPASVISWLSGWIAVRARPE